MKTITIIRHAKALKAEYLSDKERPLVNRGVSDTNLISNYIKDRLEAHYSIISSTAKRASDTAVILANNLEYALEDIVYIDDLYTFDDRKFEQVIRGLDDSFQHIIVVGHNPAVTDFVNSNSNAYFEIIKTSGCVDIQFAENTWANIKEGTVTYSIFPKKLR